MRLEDTKRPFPVPRKNFSFYPEYLTGYSFYRERGIFSGYQILSYTLIPLYEKSPYTPIPRKDTGKKVSGYYPGDFSRKGLETFLPLRKDTRKVSLYPLPRRGKG